MNIDKQVYDYVNNVLNDLENEFNIRILYAVETGSRGWGFSNEDSDYDVRFYYLQPLEKYLSINRIRDVIDDKDLKGREYDYPLDLSGWDITKVLNLHRKSNPNLREHLIHDMVYRGDCSFLDDLPPFDLNTLKHAYGSMTYNNYMKYIHRKRDNDFSPRVAKTYCYCIRQILAWILIDEYDDVNAPINIDELLLVFEDNGFLGDGLLNDMKECIEYYRSNCTKNISEQTIQNLSEWIYKYLEIMKTLQGKQRTLPPITIYNHKFHEILQKYNPNLNIMVV